MKKLFEVGMYKQSDGKYVKEEFMHNLIYPMRTSSDEIEYEQHNLWLVDERLAYFFFASSDIPFNNDKSEDRADLMFLDKSVALCPDKGRIVFSSRRRPARGGHSLFSLIRMFSSDFFTKLKTVPTSLS